jgi:tripartite-type tricarboxylate transporter receptor subunit TctC
MTTMRCALREESFSHSCTVSAGRKEKHDAVGGPSPNSVACRLARLLLPAIVVVVTYYSALSPAPAQPWPQRPITLILPYPPGGTVDTQARILGDRLAAKVGQPFIVQNKPGASGAVATEFVARAQPDGYTLLFASSAQITSVPMTEKVNYKLEDFVLISASGRGPMVLAISAAMPAKSLKEFVGHVRANPGRYTYASAGVGSVSHLVGALFAARAELQAVHVPYRGGGPAVTDLLGGHVSFYFGNSADLLPHVSDDRIRIIAVSTPKRMPQLPEVPAVSEVLPGFEMIAWQGFLAPAHTPQPIIDRLVNEISSVAVEPVVVEKLAAVGVQAIGTNQAQFAEMVQSEQSVYAEAMEAAGLQRH